MFFKNQRIGKYQVLETIGSGGFGTVYLAKDIWIDKKVAIKVPHKQGEDVEKLLQEPRLLAALDHPNIVGVITAEKNKDVFYIVMEYVDGESLEDYLRRHKILPLDLALTWFIQIADAIAYAHGKNIIHRDIRPANILISSTGLVKLADLGTSRYLLDHPFASTRIGSPPYMAPEHFQGKATLQSDIYSMGVLMYECLTGKLPFFDKNPRRLAQLARETQAKPPHHHNGSIPIDLSMIILKAMHRNQSDRYPAAEALAQELKRLNRNEQSQPTKQSQDLASKTEAVKLAKKSGFFPNNIPTKEFSNLFCWNCSRPVQKRAQACPHCNVDLK